MGLKELIEDRDRLDKHRAANTGFLNINFTLEDDVVHSEVDATLSGAMLEAAVSLLIGKLAEDYGKTAGEVMVSLTADFIAKELGDEDDEDED